MNPGAQTEGARRQGASGARGPGRAAGQLPAAPRPAHCSPSLRAGSWGRPRSHLGGSANPAPRVTWRPPRPPRPGKPRARRRAPAGLRVAGWRNAARPARRPGGPARHVQSPAGAPLRAPPAPPARLSRPGPAPRPPGRCRSRGTRRRARIPGPRAQTSANKRVAGQGAGTSGRQGPRRRPRPRAAPRADKSHARSGATPSAPRRPPPHARRAEKRKPRHKTPPRPDRRRASAPPPPRAGLAHRLRRRRRPSAPPAGAQRFVRRGPGGGSGLSLPERAPRAPPPAASAGPPARGCASPGPRGAGGGGAGGGAARAGSGPGPRALHAPRAAGAQLPGRGVWVRSVRVALRAKKALLPQLGVPVAIGERTLQKPHPKAVQLGKEGFAVAKQRQSMFSSVT